MSYEYTNYEWIYKINKKNILKDNCQKKLLKKDEAYS